jgi:acyl-CoA thioesterase
MDRPPPPSDRPPFPSELADVRAELDAVFTATPMYATLGIELRDWGPGWAHVALSADPRMGNLAGTLHGGATFTLADAAFEVACNSYGRLAVALETTCHYHHPAPLEGEITADAWEVARGGRTASYRVRVAGGTGQTLVSYLALAYRTSRWHVDADRLPDDWS